MISEQRTSAPSDYAQSIGDTELIVGEYSSPDQTNTAETDVSSHDPFLHQNVSACQKEVTPFSANISSQSKTLIRLESATVVSPQHALRISNPHSSPSATSTDSFDNYYHNHHHHHQQQQQQVDQITEVSRSQYSSQHSHYVNFTDSCVPYPNECISSRDSRINIKNITQPYDCDNQNPLDIQSHKFEADINNNNTSDINVVYGERGHSFAESSQTSLRKEKSPSDTVGKGTSLPPFEALLSSSQSSLRSSRHMMSPQVLFSDSEQDSTEDSDMSRHNSFSIIEDERQYTSLTNVCQMPFDQDQSYLDVDWLGDIKSELCDNGTTSFLDFSEQLDEMVSPTHESGKSSSETYTHTNPESVATCTFVI